MRCGYCGVWLCWSPSLPIKNGLIRIIRNYDDHGTLHSIYGISFVNYLLVAVRWYDDMVVYSGCELLLVGDCFV